MRRYPSWCIQYMTKYIYIELIYWVHLLNLFFWICGRERKYVIQIVQFPLIFEEKWQPSCACLLDPSSAGSFVNFDVVMLFYFISVIVCFCMFLLQVLDCFRFPCVRSCAYWWVLVFYRGLAWTGVLHTRVRGNSCNWSPTRGCYMIVRTEWICWSLLPWIPSLHHWYHLRRVNREFHEIYGICIVEC